MTGVARHTPELTDDRIIRAVSIDAALLQHVGDALYELILEENWLEVGDTVDDVIANALVTLENYYSNMLIGMVSSFLVALPSGWLQLDGSTHDKVDYPELWALLPAGLKTGSDFTLPDFEDAFLSGAVDVAAIGSTGGANSYSLSVAQLPAHTHTYTPPVMSITAETPTTPVPTATIGAPVPTGSTGSGDTVENRPEFIKALFAIFAGRE